MGTGGATLDDAVLAGYFEVKLSGLETIKFTDVSGLSHNLDISSSPVGSTTGAAADARTVAPPRPMTLSMKHVVLTTMEIFQWLDQTILCKAAPTVKKNGTLSIMPMGGVATPLKTWNMDDVYITGLNLESMGAGASSHLVASVEMLVGTCTPM
jgi:phage tail-like protein